MLTVEPCRLVKMQANASVQYVSIYNSNFTAAWLKSFVFLFLFLN